MAWKPLAAGELTNELSLQSEARTSNGRGGFTKAWTEIDTVWAKKIPLRGDEITRDSIVRSVSMVRFIIYFRSDLSTKQRLVDQDGVLWNIRRFDDPYGKRDRLEVDCESGVPT